VWCVGVVVYGCVECICGGLCARLVWRGVDEKGGQYLLLLFLHKCFKQQSRRKKISIGQRRNVVCTKK
jgi:hypothetical protein